MRSTIKAIALATVVAAISITTQGCDATAFATAPVQRVQEPAPKPDLVSGDELEVMAAVSRETFRLARVRLVTTVDGRPEYATYGSLRNPLARDIRKARVRITIYDADGAATDSKDIEVSDIPSGSAKAVSLQRLSDLFELPKGKMTWSVEVVSAAY